ncbi:MAG: glycosyltransferase family 4 protein, partial [Anaerolineaceae bacterium]|nr:glycosyltransferase family 4 protein [Anaerolineaceae bacterium]
VVLYAGAHGISNDLTILLQAANLLKNNPQIKFVFVGSGKEKKNLIKEAKNHNLENVIFEEPVEKSRMADVLASSDCCVAILKAIEMYKTTYPNKVFDYMAAGKPVICAIDGVIREVVEDANAGVFCPPGNPQEMADRISELAADRKHSAILGQNGQHHIGRHFDRKTFSEQFCNLINAMVD